MVRMLKYSSIRAGNEAVVSPGRPSFIKEGPRAVWKWKLLPPSPVVLRNTIVRLDIGLLVLGMIGVPLGVAVDTWVREVSTATTDMQPGIPCHPTFAVLDVTAMVDFDNRIIIFR